MVILLCQWRFRMIQWHHHDSSLRSVACGYEHAAIRRHCTADYGPASMRSILLVMMCVVLDAIPDDTDLLTYVVVRNAWCSG